MAIKKKAAKRQPKTKQPVFIPVEQEYYVFLSDSNTNLYIEGGDEVGVRVPAKIMKALLPVIQEVLEGVA